MGVSVGKMALVQPPSCPTNCALVPPPLSLTVKLTKTSINVSVKHLKTSGYTYPKASFLLSLKDPLTIKKKMSIRIGYSQSVDSVLSYGSG